MSNILELHNSGLQHHGIIPVLYLISYIHSTMPLIHRFTRHEFSPVQKQFITVKNYYSKLFTL